MAALQQPPQEQQLMAAAPTSSEAVEMPAAAVTAADADSDTEDDPGQLLNMWLGELNTLKKVRSI